MYTPVIGLEIHVELKTKSKMFCQCSADYFGTEPNSHVCPVCLGMPGALPVPNRLAIEWAQRIGVALNCKLNEISKFDRKHYFYPDLAKGYQISQYDEPLSVDGYIQIRDKKFGIRRVHMEEDTGKLLHQGEDTLIDFNRSSVPLVEIVTEPDFDNAEDVKEFLEELHTIIRYLGVSDADMEKGSMRLEPNISLKRPGEIDLPPYKVEVKNINSFRFAKQAIEFELKRQAAILDKGETPKQETRGFNDTKNETYSQRSKEEAQDYRYFPEPDIPVMKFTQETLQGIKDALPELPSEKVFRYEKEFGLRYTDAYIITRDVALAEYFESVVALIKNVEQAGQKIANAIINKKIDTSLSPNEFAEKLAELHAPKQTDMGALEQAIKKVIEANEKAVTDYKSGKESVIMFLVGMVMKEGKGQFDAGVVKEELGKCLSKRIGKD
ncbi:Asp-tRNA(Asn)/Glu-tRNA(Gln) amidotransferase subunit GatB [Candidatus Roizmanbacteria bacterium]|nr:Asp-tRNA(Asn)/Glu-tRNA(Gln) amidotransferase subunit GatB [Candidatus Roizmanbacteria bacterium]